jgi:hypothetical protein
LTWSPQSIVRLSARRQTVRQTCSWAAAGVPPGSTNDFSFGRSALTSSHAFSSHSVCSGLTRSRVRSPPWGTEMSAPTSKRSFWIRRSQAA